MTRQIDLTGQRFGRGGMRYVTELATLIKRRDESAELARQANANRARAERAITEWAGEQVRQALAAKGITPGKSVVRMKVRRTRKGRIVIEEAVCLLDSVGRVDPPTMERGALGPNASSTEMWWCAQMNWRSIRKDGSPGQTYDWFMIQGDTVEEIAAMIEHVKDVQL